MSNQAEISINFVESLFSSQSQALKELQQICFSEVTDEEAENDFYHPPVRQLLAYMGQELIGWAGIHITRQKYQNTEIKIGGYGICVHPNWQNQGIASKMVRQIIDYLKQENCEIGFLSADPTNKAADKLHRKFSFVPLSQNFSWTNSQGELKTDNDGMIAPLNSPQLFERVLEGKEPLYVGNGYW